VTLYRDVGFRYTQHVHPRFKCTGCTLDCGVINLIPFIKRIYLIEDFEAPLQVETEIHILHDVLQSKTDYCNKNDGNHVRRYYSAKLCFQFYTPVPTIHQRVNYTYCTLKVKPKKADNILSAPGIYFTISLSATRSNLSTALSASSVRTYICFWSNDSTSPCIPPIVMILSPFCRLLCMFCTSFCFFCAGRIIRKYITRMSTRNGRMAMKNSIC